MHAILFDLKRAFWSSIKCTRPWLAPVKLTPARFDLLMAVEEEGVRGVWQSRLRRKLGVAAPTVSRMVRTLEELGLVVRTRATSGDTRQRVITLTSEGLARVRAVVEGLMDSGAVALGVESVAAPRWWDPGECLIRLDELESLLWRLRDGFGGGGFFHYPWHPDDF